MAPMSAKETRVDSEELRNVHNRQVELKRLSGKISCWYCSRLKLKCDKKIPCGSCTKRGTESHCPLGGGASGSHGIHAGPTSDSRRPERKTRMLTERIRALEDALAIEVESRASGSASHPLLAEELLAIKRCVDDDDDDEDEDDEDGDEENDQLPRAFGTLCVDESRTMRYLGPAATELAFQNVILMELLEDGITQSSNVRPGSSINSKLFHASKSFPLSPFFLPKNEDALLAELIVQLPSFERATALYEAFFMNLSWFNSPVERSQIVSEIIPLFYPRRRPIMPPLVRGEHAHDLALLFIVLACGSVGDLTQNPANNEAERLHMLAKVALSVRNIMNGASLSGVQAVFLLASYDTYSGQKLDLEDRWKLVMLGCSIAASIGLHRDPSRWGLEPKMIDRRRRVFWEIYLIDLWRSLHNGRPSLFRPNVVDCEFPSDANATLREDGEPIESVSRWRYRFLRDVGTDIVEKVCSVRPMKYRDVLKLDRKVRDFTVHPFALRHVPAGDDLGIDTEFHRVYPLITKWDKEETLLYIHRNFFARAILDFSENPMRSPFGLSFLATYRGACAILRICRDNMHHMYLTVLRVWEFWSVCLVCGVIVGTVAGLGSSITFATSAFVELQYTISLFEKYCDHKVAKHGLPLLRRIRDRAATTLHESRSNQTTPSDPTKPLTALVQNANDGVTEELHLLGGTTRYIEQRSAPATHACGSEYPDDRAPSIAGRLPTESVEFDPRPFAHGIENMDTTIPSPSLEGVSNNLTSSDSDVDPRTEVPQLRESFQLLRELEQILGPSANLSQSQPASGQQQQAKSSYWPTPPVFCDPSTYSHNSLPPVMHDSSNPHTSSTFHNYNGLLENGLPMMFLDETVSQETWRSFMQQSGLAVSDSPPFDFGPDVLFPTMNSAGSYDGSGTFY